MNNDRFIVTESDFALLLDVAGHECLAGELGNAEVVDSGRIPPDVVTMNSRLLFEDQTTGKTREVTIVFPPDADATNGKISVLAPVGTALLGLAENQSILWPFPDGSTRSLRVLEVLYQPEADAALRREAERVDDNLREHQLGNDADT
jgi:regulator of nucleoside diphosphate kinase